MEGYSKSAHAGQNLCKFTCPAYCEAVQSGHGATLTESGATLVASPSNASAHGTNRRHRRRSSNRQ
jgi:hypothetical protein